MMDQDLKWKYFVYFWFFDDDAKPFQIRILFRRICLKHKLFVAQALFRNATRQLH